MKKMEGSRVGIASGRDGGRFERRKENGRERMRCNRKKEGGYKVEEKERGWKVHVRGVKEGGR